MSSIHIVVAHCEHPDCSLPEDLGGVLIHKNDLGAMTPEKWARLMSRMIDGKPPH